MRPATTGVGRRWVDSSSKLVEREYQVHCNLMLLEFWQ